MVKIKKNLLWILGVALLSTTLFFGGKALYNKGSKDKEIEILEKINKNRTIIGKNTIGKEFTPAEELSFQYFGHDTYMFEDLIKGDINSDKMYGELTQRAKYQPPQNLYKED